MVPFQTLLAVGYTVHDDALRIPGGRGPEYLRLNARVLAITKEFADTGKPIAAVCYGVQLLAAVAGIIRGYAAQAFNYYFNSMVFFIYGG